MGGATDTDTLAALLMAGFGMIAAVTSRPHWEISQDEAEKIASPMETMFAGMPQKQKAIIEKYTAPMVLSAALAGVIIPRAMIDIQEKKSGVKHGPNTRPINRNGNDTIASTTNGQPIERPDNTRPIENDLPVVNAKIAGLFEDGNPGLAG